MGRAPDEVLSEEEQQIRLDHWRGVIKQKLCRTLQNTAKSCIESGAYFMVDASGYDAIGYYLSNVCTKGNIVLGIGHGGGQFCGTFPWEEDVVKRMKGGDNPDQSMVDVADKDLGVVANLKETIELNGKFPSAISRTRPSPCSAMSR